MPTTATSAAANNVHSPRDVDKPCAELAPTMLLELPYTRTKSTSKYALS